MPSTLSFAALTAVAAAMPRRMIMGLVLLVVVGIIVIIVLNILKAQGVSLPGVGARPLQGWGSRGGRPGRLLGMQRCACLSAADAPPACQLSTACHSHVCACRAGGGCCGSHQKGGEASAA